MGPTEESWNEKLRSWLSDKKWPSEMKDLFKAIENHYIIIESALDKTDEYYQLKSDELVKQNWEQCYTNKLFMRTKHQYIWRTLQSPSGNHIRNQEKEKQSKTKLIRKLEGRESKINN